MATPGQNGSDIDQRTLWRRFWRSASGFWTAPATWPTWLLCSSLIVIVLLQLLVQYRLNYWNRDFFNALEERDPDALQAQALLFLPLAVASVVLAIVSVWGRMTTQRKWRESLTTHLINYWLIKDHYRHLDDVMVEHQNAEYRIAEDARIATDAPIDFALGLISSVLTAVVFVEVLWNVGSDISFTAFGLRVWIPSYLVVAVIVYSIVVTLLMMMVGHPLIPLTQNRNQAEAELIAAANVLRQTGEGNGNHGSERQEHRNLWSALRNVLAQWRQLCWQLMRMTLVSHSNSLLAPVIALVLCAPKYLAGVITLGELTQAVAAFTTVQSATNWLVDNYQRVADWRSSVNRVAVLLIAIDELNQNDQPAGSGASKLAAGERHQA
jgi:vitamin B12/bleomycin/antimicrobial peptide transport system ATP-binding/permease protein